MPLRSASYPHTPTTATLLQPVLASIFPETIRHDQAPSNATVASTGLSSPPLPDAFDVIQEELGKAGSVDPYDVIMKEQLTEEPGGVFSRECR
jgi:hypothetical protein